jgi:hypothetical protein
MVCLFSDSGGADRISYYLTDQYNGSYKQTVDCKRSDGEGAENLTSSDVTKNEWKVLVLVLNYSAGTWQMYENGSSTGSGSLQSSGSTSDTDSNADPVLMAYDSSGSYAGDDLFGEFVVYDSALNSSAVADLSDDLALKWDLYEVVTDNNTSSLPLGSIAVTGNNPTISTTEKNSVALGAGSIALTGNAPTFSTTENHSVSLPLVTLGLLGLEPVISVSGGNSVAIPSASLSLSGNAPTASTTERNAVDVPASSISISGNAPTLSVTENNIVGIPSSSLSLSGFAPVITRTENNSINLPVASITLAGVAPLISDGGESSLGVRTFNAQRFRVIDTRKREVLVRAVGNSNFNARN